MLEHYADAIGEILKRLSFYLVLPLLALSVGLYAQTKPSANTSPATFSRLALSGGIGVNGINLQAAVEANRYLNLRGVGNVFKYNVNNIKVNGSNGTSGVNVSGNLNFATGGVMVDYYPWPKHGFRLSPGVVFYNQNTVNATGAMGPGDSISLNSNKYYSETANPIAATASLGLNTHQQAFAMTTGWGNLLSRKGGHWSFPFELGAIFTGVPTINMTLSGYGCDSAADAASNSPTGCVNMATNSTAQTDLQSQIAKYKNDLNPLKVWPILSFGVGYNFKFR